MNNNLNQWRREMLKLGGIAIALATVPGVAGAAKNPGLRTSMKYKDLPEGDKDCSNCLQFVPGKTPKDLGGCKIFLGDTEINPKGYCVAWAKRP
jgi:hypothetical protein